MGETVQETKTYILCDECGGRVDSVDHLKDSRSEFWDWYCDCCGRANRIVREGDGYISKCKPERRIPLVVILGRGNMYLAVKGMHFIKDGEEVDLQEITREKEYYYEEHTCPTNYIGGDVEVVSVLEDSKSLDTDPHGCFEVIKVVPVLGKKWKEGDIAEESEYFEKVLEETLTDIGAFQNELV